MPIDLNKLGKSNQDHIEWYNKTFITPYDVSHPEKETKIFPWANDIPCQPASTDLKTTRNIGRDLADMWEEKYGFRLAVKMAAVGTGLDVFVEPHSKEGRNALNFVNGRTQVNLKAISDLDTETRLLHLIERAAGLIDIRKFKQAEKYLKQIKDIPEHLDNYDFANSVAKLELKLIVERAK